MTEVRETKLPGVGVRHEFTTGDGDALGVIVHHDGRREIMGYASDDPDVCHSLVTLSEHDTQTLAEILGVSHVTETVSEIRQEIEDVAIEWVEVSERSQFAQAPIGAGEFRTETGASIVAILRDHKPVPSPGADFILLAGDIVVAVGTTDAVSSLRSLLDH